jgi:hypothetical protein
MNDPRRTSVEDPRLARETGDAAGRNPHAQAQAQAQPELVDDPQVPLGPEWNLRMICISSGFGSSPRLKVSEV